MKETRLKKKGKKKKELKRNLNTYGFKRKMTKIQIDILHLHDEVY